MKNLVRYILTLCLVLFLSEGNSQVLNAGLKFDRTMMFQASANIPVLWNSGKKFDIAPGLDYTTTNSKAPSGLQPQLTTLVYIVDDKNKDFLIYGAVTTGYLFDFSKNFENQLRVSPHVYLEYNGLMNLKVGYDYMMPLKKGYPYIAVGIGGFFMFRNFRVM